MSDETVNTDLEKYQVIEEGPTLPQILTENFVKDFERGIEIYKRWVSVCYRLTRETHWVNHGRDKEHPKFSLQGPGAEALMNPLGISFEKPHLWRQDVEDDKGKFYIWWCEGYAESKTLGRRGYYVGYCDSRDVFFTSRPGWNANTGEGDVKKSAMTNWTVNLVSRLAGIRDPDPESLKRAGLNPDLVPHIEYKTSGSQQKTLEGGAELVSDAQTKRFYAMAKGCRPPKSDEEIHLYLWDTFHIKTSKELTKGNYEAACKWAETPTQKEGPGGQPSLP